MRSMEIKKRSGGIRKIYVPCDSEKMALRNLLPVIPQPAQKLASAHGFRSGRSTVTNALPHVNNHRPGAVMLSFDLSDFFGHVTPTQVEPYLPETHKAQILSLCFPDGAAQQGLPTSPALANLAGIAIDKAIRRKIKNEWQGAAYTRYADDLSLSFPSVPVNGAYDVILAVNDIVHGCGHSLNPLKLRVQHATAGRWECCGVMVDGQGVHISRRQRRILRAAEHCTRMLADTAGLSMDKIRNIMSTESRARSTGKRRPKLDPLQRVAVDNAYRSTGLREWAQLKKPVAPSVKRERERARHAIVAEAWEKEATRIGRAFGFQTADRYPVQHPDIQLPHGAVVTRDPVMIYIALGQEFWRRLKGVSLAYLPDNKPLVWQGATRRAYKERAVVYTLRDGRKAFGMIYPVMDENGERLGDILRSAGYLPASECKGALVEGRVMDPCPLPYIEVGTLEMVTMVVSRAKAYRLRL